MELENILTKARALTSVITNPTHWAKIHEGDHREFSPPPHVQDKYIEMGLDPSLGPLNEKLTIEEEVERTYDQGLGDAARFKDRSGHLIRTNSRGEYPKVALTRDLTTPYRERTVTSHRVPSLHLDKATLEKSDVADILYWLAERVENQDAEELFKELEPQLVGHPNTAAQSIVNTLGTIFYGPNNYIGPGKTGAETVMPIIEAVTTIPVTSQLDAEARAHDILTSVSDHPVADSVLSRPEMRAAQLARFGFTRSNNRNDNTELIRSGIEPNPGPGADRLMQQYYHHPNTPPPVDYSSTIYERNAWWLTNVAPLAAEDRRAIIYQLLVRAGVEMNPGPKELMTEALIAAMGDIVSNPNSMSGQLNLPSQSTFNDLMNESLSHGTYILRTGVDDRSDVVTPDSNWMELASMHRPDTTTAGVIGDSVRGRRTYAYTTNNQCPKNKGGLSVSTTLGVALAGSLQSWTDFLASQRTANNVVSGDALLGIYERMTNVDYGCYLEFTKLLAYTSGCVLQTGDASVALVPDVLARTPNVFNATVANTSIYPLSDNYIPGAGYVVNAVCITMEQYKRCLSGELVLPNVFSLNDQNVTGTVFVDPGATPESLSLRALCTLEFPFAWNERMTGELVGISAGNTIPSTFVNGNNSCYNFERSRLPGAKQSILFIKTTNDNNVINLADGFGLLTPVPNFPAAAANIDVTLRNWYDYYYGAPDPGNGYYETFDYYMKMMDLDDWKAAMLLYACVCRSKVPYLPYVMNLGANTFRIPTSDNVAISIPSVDPQILLRPLNTQVRMDNFYHAVFNAPTYTCIGMADTFSGVHPAPGVAHVIQLTGYVQDNATITDYCVFIGILAKKTLFGQSIAEVAKTNYRKIWIAGRQLADQCVASTAEWFIKEALLNGSLYGPPPLVRDKRKAWKSKLNELWCMTQKKYCGFYAIYQSYTGNLGGESSNIATDFWVYDSWINSPIILHNTFWDQKVENRWGWEPDTTYQLQQWSKDWDALLVGAVTVGGVTLGGALTIKLGDTDAPKNKKMSPRAEGLYAMSRCTHLLNVNPLTTLLQVWTGNWNSGAVRLERPIVMWFKEFLRWTSALTDSSQFRNGIRPVLGVTLPCNPSNEWNAAGTQQGIFVNAQSVVISLRQGYNMRGVGSANFNLTNAYDSLYSADLTLSADESGINF